MATHAAAAASEEKEKRRDEKLKFEHLNFSYKSSTQARQGLDKWRTAFALTPKWIFRAGKVVRADYNYRKSVIGKTDQCRKSKVFLLYVAIRRSIPESRIWNFSNFPIVLVIDKLNRLSYIRKREDEGLRDGIPRAQRKCLSHRRFLYRVAILLVSAPNRIFCY